MRTKNIVGSWVAVLILIVVFFLGITYGFVSYRLTLPPYTFMMQTYLGIRDLKNRHASDAHELSDDERSQMLEEIIHIKSSGDATEKRQEIIRILWGEEQLPDATNVKYKTNIETDRYHALNNINNVDELVVEMEYGIQSRMHLFHPNVPNNELVIYHQGHRGDFIIGVEAIERFLGQGFSVLGVAMPLHGLNNRPVVDFPLQGTRKLIEHNQLPFLPIESGIAIKYFVEPVIIALNDLLQKGSYSNINMVGVSGGGWTTTLVAAIDSRVTDSFSVAGTEPLMFSNKVPTEYEQISAELYSVISYFDLYILSSIGNGRSHIQIHNKYDPCCNTGEKTELFLDILKERLLRIGGGEFDVLIDETHAEHVISSYTLDYISEKLMD